MAKHQAAVEFNIEQIRAGDAINLMPGLGFDIVERHSATVGTGRSACAKLRTMPQPLSPAPILVFMQMFGSETEQVGESLIKHRRACSRIKQKACEDQNRSLQRAGRGNGRTTRKGWSVHQFEFVCPVADLEVRGKFRQVGTPSRYRECPIDPRGNFSRRFERGYAT